MTKRRSRGDGGLHWDEARQRWIASVTVGYSPNGKRIVRKASDPRKSEALKKLKQKVRDYEDGLSLSPGRETVADVVRDWLEFGLTGRSASTVQTKRTLAEKHIVPLIGARKVKELTAEDVDRWLAGRAAEVSTRTLQELRSILKRAITRAQARDKVKRNVVLLCELPKGQKPGRPSKALNFVQAEAVLTAAESAKPWLRAYVVLSLLTGARTEELRGLTWSHVDLEGSPEAPGTPGQPPTIMVWHSVRAGGDTKTAKSRRTLQLPQRCVSALIAHREHQEIIRRAAGNWWRENDLVFSTRTGTALSAVNVRREFRRVIVRAGLVGREWTPREMRHSFVSLLSAEGMPVEAIARLVGHAGGSAVTEKVYRQQIKPVIQEGAAAMDRIFPEAGQGSGRA
ncbi:site-specific integrase [Actinocorallia sp. B10E7]|uniref:tyrosine-type recombinase/integrase n=1 Tax=Actinocorallia sp. B10E7 TaxID=3153558 RepID=UPI00325D37DD